MSNPHNQTGQMATGPKMPPHEGRRSPDTVDLKAAAERSLAIDALNDAHRATKAAERSTVEHARSCGERLAELKAKIGEREWPDWVKTNCVFTPRVAEFYEKLARYMADPAQAARVERCSLYEIELLLGAQR